MIAAFALSILGMLLWDATAPPDISGSWRSQPWGKVELKQTKPGSYRGEFDRRPDPVTIELKWSRVERRFNGSWRKGEAAGGNLSIHLVDDQIRGAWTSNEGSRNESGTPRLAELSWTRSKNETSNQPAKSDPLTWQLSESYIAPSFDSFFPDDVEGGQALNKLWNAGDKDSRPDKEILDTVRRGFRHTTEHRTLILSWIGNKYIWGKSAQNPDAIEIMYHAADFSGERADPYGTRHYAVYFGLSVVHPKTPAILRTLAELGIRVDDPNDLGRIAWGCSNQKEDLLAFLKPFHASEDESVRAKADICKNIFSGELKAFAWAAEQARRRAHENYVDQLPQIKQALISGSTEERTKTLELILRERLSLIMDDSFIDAFAKCGEDNSPFVRDRVAVIAGDRWVWSAPEQNQAAIELMSKLAKDPNRQVRYNAVYYGLSTVRNKSDEVIRLLLEIGFADREWNMFHRIEWGLSDDQERVAELLYQYMRGPDQQHAKAAEEVFRKLTGREPSTADSETPSDVSAPETGDTSQGVNHNNGQQP